MKTRHSLYAGRVSYLSMKIEFLTVHESLTQLVGEYLHS